MAKRKEKNRVYVLKYIWYSSKKLKLYNIEFSSYFSSNFFINTKLDPETDPDPQFRTNRFRRPINYKSTIQDPDPQHCAYIGCLR
jgi:hypothetical protein